MLDVTSRVEAFLFFSLDFVAVIKLATLSDKGRGRGRGSGKYPARYPSILVSEHEETKNIP